MKRGYVPNRLDERRAYVGRFTLNGAPVTRAYLRHDGIVAGGELARPDAGDAEYRLGEAPHGSTLFGQHGAMTAPPCGRTQADRTQRGR